MTNIFVAKLDFGVTDEALKSLFEEYGTVIKCHIAKDRETDKPRGFAFIEMGSSDEAQAAISALDGYALNGRDMVVKLAEDRSGNKPRPSGPPRDRSFNEGSRPPRDDNSDSRSSKPDSFSAPMAPKSDDTSSSSAAEKASKRGKNKKQGGNEKPENRETKMSAYKKSGKKPRVELEEDDDWELELSKQKRRGWSDEEE